MPWHKPDWVDGFHSLAFLVDFQLRTWYHLNETVDGEIKTIKRWVNMAPSRLRYVAVLSGIRQNEGRRVVWSNGELSVQVRVPIEDYDI